MNNSKEEFRLSYQRVEDPNDPGSQTRPLTASDQAILQTQGTGFWGSSWTLEILNCVLAVGSLVGIIVVLYIYDGQPMPDWPYGITLNALISVLITIMKATMVFPITEGLSQLKWSWFSRGNKLSDLAALDAASRGAIGAGLALFRFVPRHLVTLGCFIIVVAAAIAPFVQQVIAVNMRAVHSQDQSSIQVCNSSTYSDWGEGAGPGMNKVPLSTYGAIYTGVFQSQSPNSNSVTMDCPTGNCTFAPYQSLGFCSRCSNITSQLDLNVSNPESISMSSYNYKLPNDFTFETAMTNQYLFNVTTEKELIQLDTKDLPLVLNFTAISAAGYGVPPQISATECALYFCVDTYEASVQNGKFSERTVSSKSTSNVSFSSPLEDFILIPDTCYSNGTKLSPSYHNDNCTYNVEGLSKLAMTNSLIPLFQGNGSLFISNRPSWSSDTVEAAYGLYGNFTDINSMFNSMASALTTNARSKVCKSSINGTTWTSNPMCMLDGRGGFCLLPCWFSVSSS